MSGHHSWPGRRSRHSAPRSHKAIHAAAAALALIALGACTSTTSTTRTNNPPSAQASVAAVGPTVTLTGSGSTFDAPFFNLAFAKYGQQYPTVAVSYSAVGSSAGIAAFSARQVDFGASDVPMTPTEQAAARGVPSFRRRSTWVARASPTT
jgi:ABC-type phosphate transport system substrate-binding protein